MTDQTNNAAVTIEYPDLNVKVGVKKREAFHGQSIPIPSVTQLEDLIDWAGKGILGKGVVLALALYQLVEIYKKEINRIINQDPAKVSDEEVKAQLDALPQTFNPFNQLLKKNKKVEQSINALESLDEAQQQQALAQLLAQMSPEAKANFLSSQGLTNPDLSTAPSTPEPSTELNPTPAPIPAQPSPAPAPESNVAATEQLAPNDQYGGVGEAAAIRLAEKIFLFAAVLKDQNRAESVSRNEVPPSIAGQVNTFARQLVDGTLQCSHYEIDPDRPGEIRPIHHQHPGQALTNPAAPAPTLAATPQPAPQPAPPPFN